MNRSRLTILVVILALLTLAPAAGSAPAAPAGGVPTLVSYQGHVLVDGAPYNGNGYFKFAIIDSQNPPQTWWSNDGTSDAGSEPGNPVELVVTNGLFSVLLGDTSLGGGMTEPLQPGAFTDPETFLRVWFSSDNSSFTQLADRRIAAAPYALRAEEAGFAAIAGEADSLDGYHAGAFQRRYAGVVVAAKAGGDYDTITAALDSIKDAVEGNRYLVWVAPGVYHEQVTMKAYVDIEGAGELATVITFEGGTGASFGTVLTADNTELRNLTVENTGGSGVNAIAIKSYSQAGRLSHVTARAMDGGLGSVAVHNVYACAEMIDVRATATGVTSNYAVSNQECSAPMTNVTATASGGASGTSYGVYLNASSPTLTDVIVTATCNGCLLVYGLYNNSSSPLIRRSTVSALGATTNVGIYNDTLNSGYTVRVDNSQVIASGNTILSNPGFSTLVGASQLAGGAVFGAVTCIGVYDENYTSPGYNQCP